VEAATIFGARAPGIGKPRLAPGRHSSPRDGVCVVELASLLAGEPFSDRPDCVDHVIGGYLRSLNDRVSHAERQRLLPYAERAVGTGTDRQLSKLRRELCMLRAGATPGAGRLRRLGETLAMRLRIWMVIGGLEALRIDDGIGEYAARVVFARHGTEVAIGLLDRLLELGEPEGQVRVSANGNGNGSEATSFADPVQGSAQSRVAAAVRELAGDAPVAQGENGGKGRNHNGHAGNLNGRDARNGHKEDIEDDRTEHGDPERETKPAENPHDVVRIP
jgi:hypothetical protein